jgi:hypothetical protein
MPPLVLELTLEQQFNLRTYEEMVKGLSQEQAQMMLLDVLRQLMMKDNAIKSLMKGVING